MQQFADLEAGAERSASSDEVSISSNDMDRNFIAPEDDEESPSDSSDRESPLPVTSPKMLSQKRKLKRRRHAAYAVSDDEDIADRIVEQGSQQSARMSQPLTLSQPEQRVFYESDDAAEGYDAAAGDLPLIQRRNYSSSPDVLNRLFDRGEEGRSSDPAPSDDEPHALDDPYLGVPPYNPQEGYRVSEARLRNYNYAQTRQELRRMQLFLGRGEFERNVNVAPSWNDCIRVAERVFPGPVATSLHDLGAMHRIHLSRLMVLLSRLRMFDEFDVEKDNDDCRAWNSSLQSLQYLFTMRRTAVLWLWTTSEEDRTQFHINQSLLQLRVTTTYEADTFTPYACSLITVLMHAQEQGLRRHGTFVAVPITVTDKDGNCKRIPVFTIGVSIKKWVYGLMKCAFDPTTAQLTQAASILPAVVAAMEQSEWVEFQPLERDSNFIAFRDGIYVLNATILPVDNGGTMKDGKYGDKPLLQKRRRSDDDSAEEEDHTCEVMQLSDAFIPFHLMPNNANAVAFLDMDMNWDTIKDKRPDEIHSVITEILIAQFKTDKELPIRQSIEAMLGRLFYPVGATGQLDNWQKAIVILGTAATGKSTIVNWFSFVLAGCVGVIGNACQAAFALAAQVDKKLIVFEEITKDMKLPLDVLLSMLSGGQTEITAKYGTSFTMKWNIPTIITGNDFAQWPNNGGALTRRLIVVYFNETVKIDPSMQLRLEMDSAHTVVRLNRQYHTLVCKMNHPVTGKHELDAMLPKYFRGTSTKISADANPIEAMLQSSDWIRFAVPQNQEKRRTVYMPESHFIALVHEFCSANSIKKPSTIRNQSLYNCLGLYNVSILLSSTDREDTYRFYPRKPFKAKKRKHCRMLCGIDVPGFRVSDDPHERKHPVDTRPFDADYDFNYRHAQKRIIIEQLWDSDSFLQKFDEHFTTEPAFAGAATKILIHEGTAAAKFTREANKNIDAILLHATEEDRDDIYERFSILATVMHLGLKWPTAIERKQDREIDDDQRAEAKHDDDLDLNIDADVVMRDVMTLAEFDNNWNKFIVMDGDDIWLNGSREDAMVFLQHAQEDETQMLEHSSHTECERVGSYIRDFRRVLEALN